MALDANVMALDIAIALGLTASTQQIDAWATGIVTELQKGLVTLPLVTGEAPSPGGPGPLADGAAVAGIILNLDESGAALATLVTAAAGYPFQSPILIQKCQIIMTYLATGLVEFATGNITGECTNLPPAGVTPPTPGPLVNGAGTDGVIGNLDGDTLAALLHPVFVASFPGPTGPTDQLKAFCNAIIDHITSEGGVTFLPGTINATCPAGGGPITGGIGVGGIIA